MANLSDSSVERKNLLKEEYNKIRSVPFDGK